MTVSARDVGKKIDATKYGEYDSNHEWNACYGFSDKCAVLASLLDEWDSTEPEGRRLVVQFVRMLAAEMSQVESPLAELLATHAEKPEIVAVTGELLASAWFCLALLDSMKTRGLKQADWLASIRDNWANLKFAKDKRGISVKELYQRVGSMLGDIPPVFR